MMISFIIPAYNEEERIHQCVTSILESIKRLDNPNVKTEIIVVNNASTDNTKKIAESFDGVKVVDENKKGLVRARQAGYMASQGDILANIDSDTLVTAKWLSTVVKEFANDDKLLALSGPYDYYDAPRHIRISAFIFYLIGYIFNRLSQILFKSGSMLQGGNFILRRKALEAIGGFDTTIEFYGEDADIGRRINKIGKVIWTFRLSLQSSGRRFMKQGLIKTGILYTINFIWITFLGKPYTQTYTDIRIPSKK